MIINGLKVTKEDFEGLLNDLKIIKALNDTSDRVALNYRVDTLITKLETNLVADEQRELQIHDKVEIISTDDETLTDYIGEVGWIIDIKPLREFPYELDFEDKSLNCDWLWKTEELKLI